MIVVVACSAGYAVGRRRAASTNIHVTSAETSWVDVLREGEILAERACPGLACR